MPDTTWEFSDESTSITVDGVQGDQPDITIGETVPLTVFLAPNGASADHIEAYNHFKKYGDYLNEKTIDIGTDYLGRPYYRETFHPESSITSHVWNIEPSDDVKSAREFWGLIVDIEDESRLVGAGEQLTMTFFVLANGDEYDTHNDVEAALRGDL